MNAERMYELFREAMDAEGIDTQPWAALERHEQEAWRTFAAEVSWAIAPAQTMAQFAAAFDNNEHV